MRILVGILLTIFASLANAEVMYCSKNVYGKEVACASEYAACMSQAKRLGGGDCEKVMRDLAPKNPSPMTGKPGTCLWNLDDPKKPVNYGCVDTVEKCQESVRAYGNKLKLECR